MSGVKNDTNLEAAKYSEGEKSVGSPETDVSTAVNLMTTQAEVAGEVADLGIEDGESFSEDENQSKAKQARGTAQVDPTNESALRVQPLPDVVVMQREVAEEIRKEIRKDERKVLLAYVGVKKMPPQKLAEIVARLRSLKDILASLISLTKEAMMGLYLKWVRKEV